MKITVSKCNIPSRSILNIESKIYNYQDSYQGSFLDIDDNIIAIDVAKAFFSSAPVWVDKLFVLRNKIVSVLGLKTPTRVENRQQLLNDFTFEEGAKLGLFTFYNITENEVILGEDDKHLNFRISLYIDQSINEFRQKTLTISKTV